MPGQIAQEVVEAITNPPKPLPVKAEQPLPVLQTDTVSVKQEEGAKPFDVIARNLPRLYSAAWWFEKGGPVGVMCLAFLGAAAWMANSQKQSQSALVESLQEANKASNAERQEIIKVLLTTQVEISNNMARMSRSIERIEARQDKKDVPDR